MGQIFDIYLLEALVNGLLFGGVLALLALGLNLIFGVVDVVWICYAEVVMFGMYSMYWLYTVYGFPMPVAVIMSIGFCALIGFAIHYLVISPILGKPPINQLLATGGLLFFLQSLATLMWGIEFKNLGLRLPVLEWMRDLLLLRPAAGLRDRRWSGMIALYGCSSTGPFSAPPSGRSRQDREIMVLMGVDSPQDLPG